ncbi:hypothetical protein ACTFIV_007236 [Dictyostelium citrinum]
MNNFFKILFILFFFISFLNSTDDKTFFKNDGVVIGGDSIQGNGGNGLEATKVEGTLEIENNGKIFGGKGANKDGNGVDIKDTTLILNNNEGSIIEGNIGIKTNGGGHIIINSGVIIGKEYGILMS